MSFYKISILDTDLSNTTSTNDLIEPKGIKLYPNPFQTILNIEQESIRSSNLPTLSLFDVAGQQIQSVLLKDVTQQISTADLGNGLYFYQFINANGQMIGNGKLVKY